MITSRLPLPGRLSALTSKPKFVIAAVALIVAAAAGITTGIVTSASARGVEASPSRPNVVFVLTDDLAVNLVQYMPHVVSMERNGTSFANYTVTDSLCCPSRSSIFSGRYPHDTGVFTNAGNDGGFNVFHRRGEESSTYATDMQKAGYRTAMMGKYLNGYKPPKKLGGDSPYVPPGWDEWDVAGNAYSEYNYTLNHNGTLQHHGHKPSDFLVNVLSHKATDFISQTAPTKQPFMLEVATFAPHGPYTPAPQDVGTFPNVKAPRTPAYDALPANPPSWLKSRTPLTSKEEQQIDLDFRKRVEAVQSVDRMIGSIEQTLAKEHITRETDIVFSSDNGYHMGDFRLLPGKQTAFDTDVHVPLVAMGPQIPHNHVVTQPTTNIDLRPTFDALGHATAPSDVDGHSALPLLHGQQVGAWRTASLVEHHGPDNNKTDPDYQTQARANPPTYSALRSPTYTYVEYQNGEREFYNRISDPYQLDNTYSSLTAAQRTLLHDALQKQTSCHGDTACWAAARAAPASI